MPRALGTSYFRLRGSRRTSNNALHLFKRTPFSVSEAGITVRVRGTRQHADK
jgi:hypothetical protein